MTRIRRTAAAALMTVALVPSLAGCWQGQNAATLSLEAAGNGAQATSGDVQINGATLVTGPQGGSATLIGTLLNTGTEPDALVGISTDPASVTTYITGGKIELLPSVSVGLGWDSEHFVNTYGKDLVPSQFVAVTLTFERAGRMTFQALTVPPTGIYEGIAPRPVAPPTS